MRVLLKNFRLVDEKIDTVGGILVEDGIIAQVAEVSVFSGGAEKNAGMIIDGLSLARKKSSGALVPSREDLPVLTPSFVDLHAHFRDPGLHEKGAPLPSELVESAALSAAAGGFGTVVCMANTRPVIDNAEKAAALKRRADILGLVDLYPALSLTKNLEGKELSGITALPSAAYRPLMLSEDGRDVADDRLFLAAMAEAKRLGIPVSCHCDFGGDEALKAKAEGLPRNVWSRIEENNAVGRVIELGAKAGCHIHIAHVSTKEALGFIRRAKAAFVEAASPGNGFRLTCEAMPHNLALTDDDAEKLGAESWGRVNPPLRFEDDRRALVEAVADGTVDAIATDHAPHSAADKEAGAPGFSGFETAFASVYTEMVRPGPERKSPLDLRRLSSLMSAKPARLLGFDGGQKRGRLLSGYRADLVIVDTEASRTIDPERFMTRGKNSPFAGRRLFGRILLTFYSGRVVFEAP